MCTQLVQLMATKKIVSLNVLMCFSGLQCESLIEQPWQSILSDEGKDSCRIQLYIEPSDIQKKKLATNNSLCQHQALRSLILTSIHTKQINDFTSSLCSF